jgi:twitching motility protein PilT
MDVPTFTMRIISNNLPPYESLGLPEIIKTITYQPQGVILVTGKTNSGKSTTLNALIDEINRKQNKKILTLESPIEYRHTSKKSIIIQKEVGPGKDTLTYFEGVKNALREDCDILVIRRNS